MSYYVRYKWRDLLVNSLTKCLKPSFAQNLVKPPGPPNSPQVADSMDKINTETMALLPSGFAILEVEINFGASSRACAFSFSGKPLSRTSFSTHAQRPGRPTHSSVGGYPCSGSGPAKRAGSSPARGSWGGGLFAQGDGAGPHGGPAVRHHACF